MGVWGNLRIPPRGDSEVTSQWLVNERQRGETPMEDKRFSAYLMGI